MKNVFSYFGILVFAGYSQLAIANTDLLGLSSLAEGASPSYGENIIVGMIENPVLKYLTASPNTSGKLKFPVNLTGSFEVEFKAYEYQYCCGDMFNLFLTSDEHKINLTFIGNGNIINLSTNSQSAKDSSNAFIVGQINTFKLSVNNNTAKLYINDVFSQKVTLTPDLTYTQILMGGIDPEDSVSSLTISGNSGVLDTGSTDICQGDTITSSVTLAPNLNLHIPSVSYQSLGGTMDLWVDLQFISSPDGRLLWELSNYGVNQ